MMLTQALLSLQAKMRFFDSRRHLEINVLVRVYLFLVIYRPPHLVPQRVLKVGAGAPRPHHFASAGENNFDKRIIVETR